MSQAFDASRSLTALEQDSTIIAVIEMSQAKWLVAGIVPGAKGNTHQQSTYWTQNQARVSQALERIRQLVPSHTRGRRSYGAGGGGCGTFIVHTNRWRLPRGPSQ